MNQIPEKLINYRVYENGNDLLGLADVELPNLEAITETVKGAGIAGEINSPVIGHYGSMTLTMNWNTITKPVIHLASPKAHDLDIRGAQQFYNSGSGEYKTVPVRVTVRCIPIKTSLGKFDMGAKTDSTNEFEVQYMKVMLNNKVEIEIDKLNYICKIAGVDYLKDVRRALGLA